MTHTITPEMRKKIDVEAPDGEKKVLLHSCCAPCSGELMELMMDNGIELTIFFHNPNIHPRKEYEIRKNSSYLQMDAENQREFNIISTFYTIFLFLFIL